jgi:hypothetical protein
MVKKEEKIIEVKSISQNTSQMVLTQLGMYCSTHYGNEIYYLFHAIRLMISDIGEELVKKEWNNKKLKRDWNKTKKNLERLEKKVIEVKVWYDAIQDKKLEKQNQEISIKRYYSQTASKISMIMPEIYDLFILLTKMTSINRRSINSEYFKILEHSGYRTLESGKPKEVKQEEKKENE